jgi:hypothetical protein
VDRALALDEPDHLRHRILRWPRLFGQIFRFDKWIVCQG